MEPVIYIEILNRFGRVAERTRVEDFPCQIGRSYANRVIIDDPFAPEVAAVLVVEGGKILLKSQDEPTREVDPRKGTEVVLGRTSLRIRTSEFAIPPRVRDPLLSGTLGRVLNNRRVLVSLALFASAVAFLDRYYSGFGPNVLAKTDDLLGLLVAALGWSGGWALAGRVTSHRGQMWKHFSLAMAAFALGLAGARVVEYLHSAAPEWVPLSFGQALVAITAVALLVSIQLLVIGVPSRKKALLGGAALATLLLGHEFVSDYVERSGYSGEFVVETSLRPIPKALFVVDPSDDFAANVDELVRELEQSQRESPP